MQCKKKGSKLPCETLFLQLGQTIDVYNNLNPPLISLFWYPLHALDDVYDWIVLYKLRRPARKMLPLNNTN